MSKTSLFALLAVLVSVVVIINCLGIAIVEKGTNGGLLEKSSEIYVFGDIAKEIGKVESMERAVSIFRCHSSSLKKHIPSEESNNDSEDNFGEFGENVGGAVKISRAFDETHGRS